MAFAKENYKKKAKAKNKSHKRRIRKWWFLRKIALPLVFKMYSRKPINERMVVFADYRAKEMIDNMQALYDQLLSKGYKIILLMKPDIPKNKIKKQLINFKYYCKFNKYYAQAKYVVVVDYYPPLYANAPRPETKVVQLWHACGAFKKWGYSTIDTNWGLSKSTAEKFPIHTNYTHIIVSSEDVAPHYAEAFNTDINKVYAYGVPRTDAFYDENYRNESREKLTSILREERLKTLISEIKKNRNIDPHEEIKPEDEIYTSALEQIEAYRYGNKKIILYAPTFRGNSAKSARSINPINIEFLRYFLQDEYCLVYKLHPLVSKANSIHYGNAAFAFDVSKHMHINEALAATDILISDYSSLIFEYSLLERPMIFYAHDFNKYVTDRGFYYNYKEMVPGPIVENNYELLDCIQNVDKWFDLDKIRMFKEKFMSACDGYSTQRIISKIFEEE